MTKLEEPVRTLFKSITIVQANGLCLHFQSFDYIVKPIAIPLDIFRIICYFNVISSKDNIYIKTIEQQNKKDF